MSPARRRARAPREPGLSRPGGHPRGHGRPAAGLPARAGRARRPRRSRTCSSEELATAAGVNSSKLRKDLSYLGSYGTRGVGYDVEYLRYQIAREIGVTQDLPVVIVGIGNLGHALANYSGFSSRGFRIVALLDSDPARLGERVGDLAIRGLDELEAHRGRGARWRSASSPPRRPPRRRSATGSSRPASRASSTSPRPC